MMASASALYYTLVTLFVALLAVSFSLITDALGDEPYMDEIFHISQAQAYCRGNFTHWDPKITTLPGLYVLSVGFLKPLGPVFTAFSAERTGDGNGVPVFCTVSVLRALNGMLSVASFVLLHQITVQIHGKKHYYCELQSVWSAFNLALFPLSFFFSSLYYTDVGSTFMVLLMYCMHLEGRNYAASFVGLVSVMFRQTNIIWVAFVAGQAAAEPLLEAVHEKALAGTEHTLPLDTYGQIKELFWGLLSLIIDPRRLIRLIGKVFACCGGYFAVWMVFAAFLAINGSVVVGDKDAHVAVFHPTQILYFAGFTLFMSFPFCLAKLREFYIFAKRRPLYTLLGLVVMLLCVHFSSPAHPYLLADNRHLTFYVWRKLLARTWWSKYIPTPGYLFGVFCILYSLRRANVVLKVTFPLLVFANVCPQLLLEFRYFTVPFLIYRLHLSPQGWPKLLSETVLYAAVNALTIYLFLEKKFKWPHEPEAGWQRIIW